MKNPATDPTQEYIKASSLVTMLLKRLADGKPVGSAKLLKARTAEVTSLSAYIDDMIVNAFANHIDTEH